MRHKIPYIDNAIEILEKRYKKCDICPNQCKINRYTSIGRCKTKLELKIASINLHKGEEPPISGIYGSGTVFFSNCISSCVYCQNFPISQFSIGKIWSYEEFAKKLIILQKRKAHNINLVTPTHQILQFLYGYRLAIKNRLSLPLVYNTFGYEKEDFIEILNNIVDIFLWDIRYFNNNNALKYSKVKDYLNYNIEALKIAYKNVGDLVLSKDNIAIKGLIIRLLVLPNNISGTKEILRLIKQEIGNNVYISLLNQYFPAYKAFNYPELSRKITRKEYEEVLEELFKLGFNNGWLQEFNLEGGC